MNRCFYSVFMIQNDYAQNWMAIKSNAGVLLDSNPLFLGVIYLSLISQQLSKVFNILIFFYLSWFSQQQLSKASYIIIFLLHDVTFLISHFSFPIFFSLSQSLNPFFLFNFLSLVLCFDRNLFIKQLSCIFSWFSHRTASAPVLYTVAL